MIANLINMMFNAPMNASKNEDACALIDRLGGPVEISRRTGFSVQRINNWKVRGIPASVRVQRPDVFWPELIGTPGAPPVPQAQPEARDAQ
jgi:hypothetical protein